MKYDKNDIVNIKGSDYKIINMIMLYDKMYYLLDLVSDKEKIMPDNIIAYTEEDVFKMEKKEDILDELKDLFRIN